MSKELHQHAIITGCVDYFCLVCETDLENEQAAHAHIRTNTHWQERNLAPYLDKYNHHHIRKVKAGYFCAFCNVLLPSSLKVDFHIAEEDHIQNKGMRSLNALENGIIAFNNVHVEKSAWHALWNDSCYLCDTDVEDENQHINNPTHILNVIQKPIKFGINDAIYRQIDDKMIQCLTCNLFMTISMEALSRHFVDNHHINCYAKCKIEAKDVSIDTTDHDILETTIVNEAEAKQTSEISTEPTDNGIKEDKPKITKELNITNILSSVATYRSNDIDVNFETDTAFCRKCCVDIQFDSQDIEKHISVHSKIGRTQSTARYPTEVDKNTYCPKPEANEMTEAECNDHSDEFETNTMKDAKALPAIDVAKSAQDGGESDSNDDSASIPSSSAKIDEPIVEINNNDKCKNIDVKVFANENHLTYNEKNASAFCRICEVKLPSSYKSMKEHVQGVSHNKKVKAVESQIKHNRLPKQNMKKFVFSVKSLTELYPEDCLVNGKYCLNQLSFYLITMNSRGLRCLLCEKNIFYTPPFYKFQVQAHVDDPSHHDKMEVMPVITSFPKEFIREIRPESFHCGFCNLVMSSWSEMENHLKSTDHIENQATQAGRLQREIAIRMMRPFRRAFI